MSKLEQEGGNFSMLHIAYEERSVRFKCKWIASVYLRHPNGKIIEFYEFGDEKTEARDNLIAAIRRAYELADDAERDTVENVSIDWKI